MARGSNDAYILEDTGMYIDNLTVSIDIHIHTTDMHFLLSVRYLGLARTVYIFTVYDRIFDELLQKIPCMHHVYMVLANPTDIPSGHAPFPLNIHL